ncbi:MAG: NAD(P)H-dependent oxidoreductase [Pseudomonadota bacterium]
MIRDLLDALNWRYAVKKFDHRTVDQTTVEDILEAARLAPTSFGLQPFQILLVTDSQTRKALADVSMGQSKVVDSSHLIVFASFTEFHQVRLQEYLRHAQQVRGEQDKSLQGMEKTLSKFFQTQSQQWLAAWAKRQTYIAMGTLLCACAMAKVDACPMEGFEAKKYDEILDLKKSGLTAAVIVTLGYRASNDAFASYGKIRKPLTHIVSRI